MEHLHLDRLVVANRVRQLVEDKVVVSDISSFHRPESVAFSAR